MKSQNTAGTTPDFSRKWGPVSVASKIYGPSERTIQEWGRKNIIDSIVIGRLRLYSFESLDQLFAKARSEQPEYQPRPVPWNEPPGDPAPSPDAIAVPTELDASPDPAPCVVIPAAPKAKPARASHRRAARTAADASLDTS